MFYVDLHIHSKYSRATSRDLDLENLAYWACRKGLQVLGTGDFTHPAWFEEICTKLVPAEPGLFRLSPDLEQAVMAKSTSHLQQNVRFMLQVEISTIYKKGDKTRKVHHLLYAPSLEAAETIRRKLGSIGNIASDGRPILGLDSRDLLEIVLEAGPECYLIPAHIWTPWFSALGSKSGFDSIAECYGDLAEHIFAVETGLSADPPMLGRVSSLDNYRVVSNSDAHSPAKIGREASVFECDMDYFAMRKALMTGEGYGGTLEMFPEEGKYHMDGHRKCSVCLEPEESRKNNGLCPACGKPLTLGVMYRVVELADRAKGEHSSASFRSLIPLQEIVSELMGMGVQSKRVQEAYEYLLQHLGSELAILDQMQDEQLDEIATPLFTEAIRRMRNSEVLRSPGYDGEYGKITLFKDDEIKAADQVGPLFREKKKKSARRVSKLKPLSTPFEFS